MAKILSLEERFYSKAQPTDTGCLLWTGARHHKGYGHFKVNGKTRRAHVVSYELNNGPVPDGLLVLHTCDNKLCILGDHLYAGTHAQNMADAVARHRFKGGVFGRKNPKSGVSVSQRGELNRNAKLTKAQVVEIRSLPRARGRGHRPKEGQHSIPMLAKRYGVTPSAIANVLYGATWI